MLINDYHRPNLSVPLVGLPFCFGAAGCFRRFFPGFGPASLIPSHAVFYPAVSLRARRSSRSSVRIILATQRRAIPWFVGSHHRCKIVRAAPILFLFVKAWDRLTFSYSERAMLLLASALLCLHLLLNSPCTTWLAKLLGICRVSRMPISLRPLVLLGPPSSLLRGLTCRSSKPF
jgi:hypothetical protein